MRAFVSRGASMTALLATIASCSSSTSPESTGGVDSGGTPRNDAGTSDGRMDAQSPDACASCPAPDGSHDTGSKESGGKDTGPTSTCLYGTKYPDGCPAASMGLPNYPKLLDGYAKRPPWNVAGVDYHVGLGAGTPLKDPSTATLPSGCSYSAPTVSCSGKGITLAGFDFSLHGGMKLVMNGAGDTITGNNFALAPSCSDPVIDFTVSAGSSITINYNDFDGGGSSCGTLVFGTMLNGKYGNGSTSTVEYNVFGNTPQDVLDAAGPSTGAAAYVLEYNLFYVDGFQGHPDGTQFNGGNFDSILVEFNTFYNAPPALTQPFHLEAQLTAALSNSVVAFNTMPTIGTCMGGTDYPTGCSVNIDIACKQDTGKNTNTNFSAYANYIDWSGGISALSNGYGCPSASWGSPTPNYDMKTGAALPVP
jgi:hypothetical protein